MSVLSAWTNCSRSYKNLFILLMMIIISESGCTSVREEYLVPDWKVLPSIPPAMGETVQPGLAGPIAGVHGNFMLVAGGANFEGGMPWRGGRKVYHDEIFLLKKTSSGQYLWQNLAKKLPFPIAYSACLSTKQGVISIGGEDMESPVKEVVLFSFADGKLSRKNLPDLPQAVSSAGAAAIGSTIYLAGGVTKTGATSSFYSYDLDHPDQGWLVLPQLPEALSHAVVVSQWDGEEVAVYVIGGRNKKGELSTFMSTVWKYLPSSREWNAEGEILADEIPLGLSAGTGIAAGSETILLIGGDPGIYFDRTEQMNIAIEKASTLEEQQRLRQEKDTMLTNHPGFSKDLLAYNTRLKSWRKIGEMNSGSQVTTTAFYWNGTIVVPSGEIRPGVRTPWVMGFEIQTKTK